MAAPPFAYPQGDVSVDVLVDRVLADLNKEYIDDASKPLIDRAMRDHLAQGKYDSFRDAALADALTTDLQAAVHDKHLGVGFSTEILPVLGLPRADMIDPAVAQEQRYGIVRVEHLQGGVGLIQFNIFFDAGVPGYDAAVAAAFAEITDTDALILDNRTNFGGTPYLVASYFLGAHVHVADSYTPWRSLTVPITTPAVIGTNYARKPLYVLTSQQTFSGASNSRIC